MESDFGAQLLDHLQSGVILLDDRGRILAWNQWMARHSRLTLSEVSAKRLDELFPEVRHTRLEDAIEQALRFRLSSMLAPGLNAAILPLDHQPGDRRLARRMQPLVYVTPMRHEPYACLIQIQDMTATVRREHRLRAQSTQLIATTYRDALTGVGNRRRLDHDLAVAFSTAQKNRSSLALLMIDIDDFKAYNDSLGHLKGDDCLILVAKALQEGLRLRGDCVSRYGGEEFALPLPETDRDMACAIAERLRLLIEGLDLPHAASRVGTRVTVSIGVTAMIPGPEQSPSDLLGLADRALYRAKDAGRNCCFFNGPERDALPAWS
ncbi:diguanylate cyclase domain-containing protein [Thiocystis violascens]|uniref:diguanylate cyclase n=1 Tax=Thiocystis violascens (strain ATCC 17096 / DSM 198 / 6111) TaxID=765911 RepID=I3Y5W7_THIV6|nr:diguanylate cyclase [Thiocystis violascens]AFL72385.1 diguanylate cyclase (GGDEF) domain-containing protein [Thiocystis violascens DSM 198]